jgi:carbon monoxide dehydrogenase subunit G
MPEQSLTIAEESTVKAPVKKVWDFLLDIRKLASAIPGVEEVKPLGTKSYEVTQSIKVGIVTARIKSKVKIIEIKPPNHISAAINGQDAITGSPFDAEVNIQFSHLARGQTRANYQWKISLGGVLGVVGGLLIRQIYDEIATGFAQNLKSQLETTRS